MSDKAMHTPGPWRIELGGAYPCITAEGFVGAIAAVKEQTPARWGTPKHREFLRELEANARLIAAAPDLLAALRHTRCHHCGFLRSAPRTDHPCSVCAEAVAAIAKAEGFTHDA